MTLPAAYFDGDGDSNRLDQPSDHHDKHASWQTDASGNVTGLVGPDGVIGMPMANGLRDVDAGTLVYVRDHAYSQIVGDATHDSHHQWFKDNGLFPYTLTVNTTGSSSPGSAYSMSWAECVELVQDGCEISNHANRHIQSLARATTGIYLTYSGANATATAYVSDLPRTLNLVDSGATSFDLTNASYDTLTELVAAVNAVPGWWMSAADELDGSERSADLLVVTSPGKDCKTGAYFGLNGGVLVRYKGSAYRTAMAKVFNNQYLMLFGDGCEIAELNFTNAAYDTLTELVAAVNALESGDWEATLINNGGTAPTYCDGSEPCTGNLRTGDWQDVYHRYAWFSAGLPQPSVWRKLLNKAKTVAAANGVSLKNFADVGGGAWSQVCAHISEFSNLSRCSNVKTVIRPGAIPADVACVLPNFSYDDNTSVLGTATQLATVINALADSPGFVCSLFSHQFKNDGSSGRNFLDQQDLGGAGLWWQYEAKGTALLGAVKTQTDANRLNTLTQQDFYRMRPVLTKPKNRLFNPRWINSGDAMHGLASDAGYIVPGWLLVTPSITSLSVADGVMTVENGTYSLNNKYFRAMVWLQPGKTYEVGISIETLIRNADQTGCALELAPVYGWESLQQLSTTQPGAAGVYIHTPEQPGKTTGDHRWMVAAFTVPLPQRKPVYIRSRNTGPFDLSTNKNIRININSIGLTANIDCSTGAVSAAAVEAWEVANAINAGVKATSAYAGYSQFHNIATAESGKVILTSPYSSNTSPVQGQIDISAGTSASAVTAIFGTPVVGSEPPHGASFTGGFQTLVPYYYTVYINATNKFRLHSPTVTEIEGFF